jgi:uncharacterized membrane protein
MSLKIAQFVNLVLIVLVAGALWGTWLGLSRSIVPARWSAHSCLPASL